MKDIFNFFEKVAEPPIQSAWVLAAHLRGLGVDLVMDSGRVELPARVVVLDDAAVRALSYGVVRQPETINYRTAKPERGGLFCEQIFGPVADYECGCGKYKRMKHRGVVCEKCGVEVTQSRVRNERFGHVELAIDVAHPLLDGVVVRALPVLPPDLRPLVPLEGGRFATSDVNDLYRRLINRNNRLSRLLEIDAPEPIIENEKRTLGESVEALLINERAAEPVTGPDGRPLASLTASLLRFARNVIHKTVDYSGAAPLVSDPSIDEGACRLPRALARELLAPWLYGWLERSGHVTTIKSAKRAIAGDSAAAIEALESVAAELPALLMVGDRLVGRQIGLWDHPAVGVSPATARALGRGLAQIHIPLTEAGRAECRAMTDCPAAAPFERSGWLSRLIDGGDLREALSEAASGATDDLDDPAVRAAFKAR